jgi:hypothetical protein
MNPKLGFHDLNLTKDIENEGKEVFLNGRFKKEMMEILWEENKNFG